MLKDRIHFDGLMIGNDRIHSDRRMIGNDRIRSDRCMTVIISLGAPCASWQSLQSPRRPPSRRPAAPPARAAPHTAPGRYMSLRSLRKTLHIVAHHQLLLLDRPAALAAGAAPHTAR